MSIDFKEIKKITRFMKKESIYYFKTDQFELKVDLSVCSQKKSYKEDKKIPYVSFEEENQKYTEEDVLLWSAPGILPNPEEYPGERV